MGRRQFVIRDPHERQDRHGEADHLTFEPGGVVVFWLLTDTQGNPLKQPFMQMAIGIGPRTVIHEVEIPAQPKKRTAKKAAKKAAKKT